MRKAKWWEYEKTIDMLPGDRPSNGGFLAFVTFFGTLFSLSVCVSCLVYWLSH